MDQQSQHSEGNDNEAASSSVDVTAKRPRRAAPARAAAAASSSSKPKKSRPVQKDSNGSEQAGTSNADMNGDNDDDDEDEDVCPACVNIPYEQRKNKAKHVPWIACDECQKWFHWPCIRADIPGKHGKIVPSDMEDWFCTDCIKRSIVDENRNPLAVKLKETPRKSARKKSEANKSGADGEPVTVTATPVQKATGNPWYHVAEHKKPIVDAFQHMRAEDVTVEWIDTDPRAFMQPFIIDEPEGLDMSVLPKDMRVSEIAEIVGPDRPLDVIDVASQSGLNHWTLGKWAKYYESPSRDKVRNVISLELSSSPLRDKVAAPKVIRDIDWVEQIWPEYLKEQDIYPQVMRYCLMSPGESWTDWHIDFSASSVFYHVLRGSKIFYFISPTPENLRQYEKWSGGSHDQCWLGDECDKVYKMELKPGNTAIIPSGWIHCVYTPSDSLVIGGNFLHSYNIALQLRVYQIELNTKVPKKFRFPYFVAMLWYVGLYYFKQLEKEDHALPRRVLEGLKALSAFLIQQAWRISEGADVSSERRRLAMESINWELIEEPDKLANDLQTAVYTALGETPPAAPLDNVPQFNADDFIDEASIKALVQPLKRANSKAMGLVNGRSGALSGPTPIPYANGTHSKRKAPAQYHTESPAAKSVKTKHSEDLPDHGHDIHTAKAESVLEAGDGTSRVQRGQMAPVSFDRIEMREHPVHGDERMAEIRTTTSDKYVQKLNSGTEEGSWVVETRRVITMIERAYFAPGDPVPKVQKSEEADAESMADATEPIDASSSALAKVDNHVAINGSESVPAEEQVTEAKQEKDESPVEPKVDIAEPSTAKTDEMQDAEELQLEISRLVDAAQFDRASTLEPADSSMATAN